MRLSKTIGSEEAHVSYVQQDSCNKICDPWNDMSQFGPQLSAVVFHQQLTREIESGSVCVWERESKWGAVHSVRSLYPDVLHMEI